MPAQVIIKLIADPSGLEPGIDILEKLQQVDKSTADEFRAANKAFADRGKVIDQSVTSTEKFANSTKKLTESIVGGGINQATQNIEKLGKEIEKSNADTVAFAKTIGLAKQKLATLNEGSAAFDKLSQEISASELAMENFSKEATSSRGRLKQYRETLLQLEDAGLDGTQVFNDLAEAAGELTDQVGDTQARVRALASDTFKFDVAIQAVQGVAGAFSVAQGAAALFGTENEEVSKALLKVNAAMSILQGLQAIQNILQSESALSIGATIALQRVAVLQTDLQTAAESRFIIVRYAAAAAQRVLNFVMAANPAGVVLFAIAALGTALFALTRNTDDAAEAQKKLNEQLETSIKIAELSTKVIQQQADVTLAQLKKRNASAQEIRKAETQALRDQVNVAFQIYQKANNNLATASSKEKEEKEKRLAYLRASGVSEEAINNASLKQDAKYTAERVKALEIQQDAAQTYFDLQNKLQVKNLEDQKTAQDDALKNASAFAQARVSQAKKDSIAETQAQKAAIQVRLQEQLNTEGLLEGERAALIADANRQIEELTLKAQQQLLDKQIDKAKAHALVQRDAFRKLEAESAVLELQAQKDSLGKNEEAVLLIETQKNEAIRSLRQSLFKDLETLEVTQYGRSKERQKAFNKEVIKEQVLQGARLAQARLLAKQQEAQEKTASKEKELADERELRQRLADTSLTVASSLAGSLNEIAKNQSDYELSVLQDTQNKKIESLKKQLDEGTITQEIYNSRALALQEDYDRKTRVIKIRAAQQEKQLALFQAFIAQSLAILSVLKDQTIPFAIKPVFIGLAITQAVAQIAAIASKPIPAFKKGTTYKQNDGPGLIGEAGPELFNINGKWGYAAGPMILDLPKGSKVIPTLETDKIMQRYDLNMPPIRQDIITKSNTPAIDYDKLARKFGIEMGKLPLHVSGFDKDGPYEYTTTMQARMNYLNRRYGSR